MVAVKRWFCCHSTHRGMINLTHIVTAEQPEDLGFYSPKGALNLYLTK